MRKNIFTPPWNFETNFDFGTTSLSPSPSPSLSPSPLPPQTTTESTPPPARCTRSSSVPLVEPLKQFRKTRSDRDKQRLLQHGLQLAKQLKLQKESRHEIQQQLRNEADMAAEAAAAAASAASNICDKLHPTVFHGKQSENAVEWLDYFIASTDYKKLTGDHKLPFLKL
jgi:hypothetical protein